MKMVYYLPGNRSDGAIMSPDAAALAHASAQLEGKALTFFPFADLINDIQEFHTKFDLPAATQATVMPPKLAQFRIKFMQEELEEYQDADATIRALVRQYTEDDGHIELPPDAVQAIEGYLADQLDALVDLAYVVVGCAYLQFGPSKFAEAWERVHTANMAKERAVSADQSKRGSTYDVVKPVGWKPPDHSDLVSGFLIRTDDIE